MNIPPREQSHPRVSLFNTIVKTTLRTVTRCSCRERLSNSFKCALRGRVYSKPGGGHGKSTSRVVVVIIIDLWGVVIDSWRKHEGKKKKSSETWRTDAPIKRENEAVETRTTMLRTELQWKQSLLTRIWKIVVLLILWFHHHSIILKWGFQFGLLSNLLLHN